MDHGRLCLFLCLVFLLSSLTNSLEPDLSCRQCKPGQFVSRPCSQAHDTVCSPCPGGTYTTSENTLTACSNCSTCEFGFFVLEKCSPNKDTVCESCLTVSESVSTTFQPECSHKDDPGLVVEDGHNIQSAEKKENVAFDDDILKGKDFDEGSGVEESSEALSTSQPFTDSLGEGSGVPEEDYNGTTSGPDVPFPEEVEKEDFLPPSTKRVTVPSSTEGVPNITETVTLSPTTTEKPLIIVIPDTGIQLNDTAPLPTNNTPVDVEIQTQDRVAEIPTPETSTQTQSKPSTTARRLILQTEHGVKLTERPSSTGSPKATTVEAIDVHIEEDSKDEAIIYNPYDYEKNEDEPQAVASKGKESDDTSGRVSVGVVVAVGLVAAVVFFVLGFLASRYWRRRQRTFNVLEAEKTNGTNHQSIEFTDPERNLGTGGIYDEIPERKVNGKDTGASSNPKPTTTAKPAAQNKPEGTRPKSGATAPADDHVYSKPIKRNSNPPVTSAATNGSTAKPDKESWAGHTISHSSSTGSITLSTKPERLSGIKYMDEATDDEGETDKLIPKQNQQTAANSSATARQEDIPEESGIIEESNQRSAPRANDSADDVTETTPMISTENETEKR